jgi:hypothetical protein
MPIPVDMAGKTSRESGGEGERKTSHLKLRTVTSVTRVTLEVGRSPL